MQLYADSYLPSVLHNHLAGISLPGVLFSGLIRCLLGHTVMQQVVFPPHIFNVPSLINELGLFCVWSFCSCFLGTYMDFLPYHVCELATLKCPQV